MLPAEIGNADGEADDKEYRQRQQVRQVEIRRFRGHRFGVDGLQTASNRHRGRLKNKNENRRRDRSVFRQRFFRDVLQGCGNAEAERGVVGSGEVAVEFHERFLQCENIFRRPQKQDGAV